MIFVKHTYDSQGAPVADGQVSAALGGYASAITGKIPSKYQDTFKSGLELSGYASKPVVAPVATNASPTAPKEGAQFAGGGIGAKLKAMWSTTGGKVAIVGALALTWYLVRRGRKK